MGNANAKKDGEEMTVAEESSYMVIVTQTTNVYAILAGVVKIAKCLLVRIVVAEMAFVLMETALVVRNSSEQTVQY